MNFVHIPPIVGNDSNRSDSGGNMSVGTGVILGLVFQPDCWIVDSSRR